MQLVGFHAQYHTKMQHSKKISSFFLVYYWLKSLRWELHSLHTTLYTWSSEQIKSWGFTCNLWSTFRSSCPMVFYKMGVCRNFAKFTGKHLCQSLFFNKVAGRPATLLKRRLWHRCFPVNFAKFLKTPFLKEHLQWLLLNLCGKNLWVSS